MKDNFSSQSELYAQYRPHYPKALYDHIFKYVPDKKLAWDCGTGNGQAAAVLADYFTHVHATDISAKQMELAIKKENITYAIEPAENCSLSDQSTDLITIAQAIHWFDFDKFYAEVKRVGKKNSVIAVMVYGLIHCSDPEVQKKIEFFYKEVVGPYWDKERKYIDENYQTIPFPFDPLPALFVDFPFHWTKHALTGYLDTWSAVQHYKKAQKINPVPGFIRSLDHCWQEGTEKQFSFPFLLRAGIIKG